jgi:hypothetical protein
MSTLDRLASRMGARGDEPDRELARELAASGDANAIAEIAAGLEGRYKAVQSDCIKTLYEIGYLRPELISGYAGVFLGLLQSRNNRLVWGAMIALATVARLTHAEIRRSLSFVYDAMEKGSVITVDNGVRVLAAVAACEPAESAGIVNYLLDHLASCRTSEVPQHAESSLPAANAGNREAFIAVLRTREAELSSAQAKRLGKVCKALDKLK